MSKQKATKETPAEKAESGENRTVSLPPPTDLAGWALIGGDNKLRRQAIRLLLAQNPRIACGELASIFGVGPDCITDDLSALRTAAGLAFREQDVAETIAEEIRMRKEIADASLEDASILSPHHPSRSRNRGIALKALDSRSEMLFRMGYYREVPKEHRILTEGDEKDDRQSSIQDEIWATISNPEQRKRALALEALLQSGTQEPGGPGERDDAGEVQDPAAHRETDGGTPRARRRRRGPTDSDDAAKAREVGAVQPLVPDVA
jgi:hypothetical protein